MFHKPKFHLIIKKIYIFTKASDLAYSDLGNFDHDPQEQYTLFSSWPSTHTYTHTHIYVDY